MLLRKNDSGRSIVEMLGVLAIMGIITVMGIAGYSQAIGKINRNKVVEEITKLAQETRSIFAGRTSYNQTDGEGSAAGYNIGTEVLKKMGFKLAAPYGGDYVVKSMGAPGADPAFSVTVCNVPAADCLQFMVMAWTDVLTADGKSTSSQAYFGANGSSEAVSNESCPDNSADACMSVYFR